MRPSPVVNQIIGSVLVRGLQLYSVKLYAFVFASNHFHLILSGNPNEISRFMAHLHSNIARQVGELLEAYWEASAAYLRGAFEVPFPAGTFRPPIGVLN